MTSELSEEMSANFSPRIEKYSEKIGDASSVGAFPFGDYITFVVKVERKAGMVGATLKISPDGGEGRDLPLHFPHRTAARTNIP